MTDAQKIEELELKLAKSFPKVREPDCGYGYYQCNRCNGMISKAGEEIYYPPNHYNHWCHCYDTKISTGSASSFHRGKDVL